MNGARHIREALRSILAQQGTTFNIVISDDRSDDETLRIVSEEAGDRAQVVVNTERLGLAGNWNRCVAESQTPYIAIVHQDDVLLPGHLARHVDAFDSDPNVGLVASASTVIDEDGREFPENVVERGGLGSSDRAFAPGEALPPMTAGNPLRCSAVSIRVAAHIDVGGFNPSLRYVVDWEFWLRVARRWGIAWRAHPSVAVRWHESSETHRFKTGTTDLDEIERILGELQMSDDFDSVLAAPIRAAARRRLARAYLNRAHVAVRGGDGGLARRCFIRSLTLQPSLLGAVASDPRLAVQMAGALLAPGLAGRWLGRTT
jgi:glycosyltransferase involved in cell wall biosynthesis